MRDSLWLTNDLLVPIPRSERAQQQQLPVCMHLRPVYRSVLSHVRADPDAPVDSLDGRQCVYSRLSDKTKELSSSGPFVAGEACADHR